MMSMQVIHFTITIFVQILYSTEHTHVKLLSVTENHEKKSSKKLKMEEDRCTVVFKHYQSEVM